MLGLYGQKQYGLMKNVYNSQNEGSWQKCSVDRIQTTKGSVDNLNSEISSQWTLKKRENLTNKINKLETNNLEEEYQRLVQWYYDFKKSYQPRSNVVKDQKCDLVAVSHSILNS